jgi:hypothetical protein
VEPIRVTVPVSVPVVVGGGGGGATAVNVKLATDVPPADTVTFCCAAWKPVAVTSTVTVPAGTFVNE